MKEEPRVYYADIYEKLAAKFDKHHTRQPGNLTYINGEQAVSRLNEVLGMAGWTFRINEHGYNQEADEIWVLGELVANCGGTMVTRQQFGSQKVNRKKETQAVLDLGFDLKGAATDCLKKCASLIGVGLYLYDDEAREALKETPEDQAKARAAAALKDNEQRNQPKADGVVQELPAKNPAPRSSDGDPIVCEQCGEDLKEIKFRDGTVWTPSLLSTYGQRKHGRTLCMQHYREANEARKRAESQVPAMDEVPF